MELEVGTLGGSHTIGISIVVDGGSQREERTRWGQVVAVWQGWDDQIVHEDDTDH